MGLYFSHGHSECVFYALEGKSWLFQWLMFMVLPIIFMLMATFLSPNFKFVHLPVVNISKYFKNTEFILPHPPPPNLLLVYFLFQVMTLSSTKSYKAEISDCPRLFLTPLIQDPPVFHLLSLKTFSSLSPALGS